LAVGLALDRKGQKRKRRRSSQKADARLGNRLACGRLAENQIVAILREAETAAFSKGDYCRCVEFRSLKTRLQNGPQFQIQRYALPAPYLFPEPPSVRCDERGIEVRSHSATVGRLSIWLDRWAPLYAKGGGDTRCGILTEMGEADLDQALQRHGLRLGWVAQLRIWSRKTDYGEYELSTRREFFFD
jgi:hypothetical protein